MGGGMLKQIQKMQADMQAAQEALAHETVDVSVGGGAVSITITGHQRIKSITLNKDVIDTSDPEWVNDLQDMLVLAVNQAVEQSQSMAAERMESITGGLGNLPGLGGLFG
jgi:DNA-binding YbaB/EbfC family protein